MSTIFFKANKRLSVSLLFLIALILLLSSTASRAFGIAEHRAELYNKDNITLTLVKSGDNSYVVEVKNNGKKDILSAKLESTDIKGIKIKSGKILELGDILAGETKLFNDKALVFDELLISSNMDTKKSVGKTSTEVGKNVKTEDTSNNGLYILLFISSVVFLSLFLKGGKTFNISKKHLSLAIISLLTLSLFASAHTSSVKAYSDEFLSKHSNLVEGNIKLSDKEYKYKGTFYFTLHDSEGELLKNSLESLKKLNENENLKMQVNAAMDKDDISSDITKSELYNLKSLDLTGANIEDFAFLNMCHSLEELNLGNQQNSLKNQDLTYLKNAKSLKKLILSGNSKLSSVAGIAHLTNLEILRISETSITDISPLKTLTNLRELSAFELGEDIENPEFDFSSLKHFVNMEKLDINEVPVKDLSFVKNMPKLKSLDVNEGDISSLSGIENAKNLTTLRASHNDISDALPLANMKNLEVLELDNNALSDISALKDLMGLKRLDLTKNKLTSVDAISNLVNLNELKLNHNKITDLKAVGSLQNLTKLSFDFNEVKDLNFASNLEKLQSISGKNNGIQSISPLKNLSHLEELQFANNQISDISQINRIWSKDSFVNIGIEDQKISIDIPFSATEGELDPLGKDYTYSLLKDEQSPSGVEISQSGKLKLSGVSKDLKSFSINFESKANGYNKKHSGKININII